MVNGQGSSRLLLLWINWWDLFIDVSSRSRVDWYSRCCCCDLLMAIVVDRNRPRIYVPIIGRILSPLWQAEEKNCSSRGTLLVLCYKYWICAGVRGSTTRWMYERIKINDQTLMSFEFCILTGQGRWSVCKEKLLGSWKGNEIRRNA